MPPEYPRRPTPARPVSVATAGPSDPLRLTCQQVLHVQLVGLANSEHAADFDVGGRRVARQKLTGNRQPEVAVSLLPSYFE